jgi:hypothetical protein
MQKIFLVFIILCVQVGFGYAKNSNNSINKITQIATVSESRQLYTQMKLENKINYDVFHKAYEGYKKINHKKELLTVVDFTKPSTQERLFVLDMKQRKILFSTHVSHGRNSGGNYATSFSNKNGSYQSSLGFYLTEGTYNGKNGYSLILNGLEKGFNDKARERAIVIHGAAYANPSSAKANGRLGRSLGCPALPQSVSKEIINVIKGGSVLFIYANDKNYLSKSIYINNNNTNV